MAKKRKTKKPTTADLPDELIGVTSVRMTSFRAENVLRIKAAHFDLDALGNVVTIEGDNEQGKSSALKAVEMAIAGAGVIPADPIHGERGQGKVIARFNVERPTDPDDPTSDVENIGLVATREFKRGKPPKLVVKIDGQRRALASPQTIFDVLMDHIALDPLQFQRMPDDQKQHVLAEMAGLDLHAINSKRDAVFAERTEINREVKRLEAELASTTFHDGAPKEEVVVAELMAELEKRREVNAEGKKLSDEAAKMVDDIRERTEKIAEMKKKLAEAERDLEGAVRYRDDVEKKISGFIPADEDMIRKQLDEADTVNAKVRDNARHLAVGTQFEAEKQKADALTEQLQQIDDDKREMLLEAEERLPVSGLGFTEEGVVTYKGKPFSQAGRSATAVVSCGVSMKLNESKMLKVLLIDDAEKMDGKTKRKVAEMGVAAGFQIFMAQVMPDAGPSDGAVIIEDGEVTS